MSEYAVLFSRIGYVFNDVSLLIQALTTPGFANQRGFTDKQRAWAIHGDALLDHVVLDSVYTQDFSPSKLDNRRQTWTKNEHLSKRARELGIAEFIRLSPTQTRPVQESQAATTVEALVHAVRLDAGLEAARSVAKRLLGLPA